MKTKSMGLVLIFILLLFNFALIAQQPTFTSVFWYPNSSALGYAIVKTFDSNYLVAGERDNQGLVFKMNSAGNIVWAKRLSFPGNFTMLTRIIPTHDSCFFAIGNMNGDNIVCVKITESGDTLWSKSIDLDVQDYAFSVCQNYDRGYLIAGYSSETPMASSSKMTIIKLDSMGNLQWTNRLVIGSFSNQAYSIRQTPDSGSVIIGSSMNVASNEVATLIKLNSSGVVSWSKKLELFWTAVSSGYDVIVLKSGFLCYVNVPETGTVIVKTDFMGNILWCRKYYAGSLIYYGNPNIPKPTLQTLSDGCFAMVTPGPFGEMLKIDSTGNVIWSKGIFLDVVDMIESGDHGFLTVGNGPLIGVILAGQFEPQTGIIKSDSLGNSVDCVLPGWDFSDTCTANFVTVPVTSNTGGSVVELHPVISNALLESRLGCVEQTGGIGDHFSQVSEMTVYPTPVSHMMHIILPTQLKTTEKSTLFNIITYRARWSSVDLEVYNLFGEKILSRRILFDEKEIAVDVSKWQKGMYVIRLVYNNNTVCTAKVIRN